MSHGRALAIAILVYPSVPPVVTAALLIVVGLSGPFLTGGISSRLPVIARPDRASQRRAQGGDVATYGLGGTTGPSVVAIVSEWTNPIIAALCFAGVTLIAATVVRLLPPAPPDAATEVPKPLRTFRIMVTTPPLYLTMAVALPLRSSGE